MEEQKRLLKDKLKGLAIPIILICLATALLFLIIFSLSGKWAEISFTLEHPLFVRELRMVYEHEHKQADNNVLLRQRSQFSEEPQEASASVKK